MVKVGSVSKLNIENLRLWVQGPPNSRWSLFEQPEQWTAVQKNSKFNDQPEQLEQSEQTEQLVSSEQTEYRTIRFERTVRTPRSGLKWPSKVRMSLPDPWSLIPTRFSPYPVAGPFWWPLIRCLNKFLSPTIPGIKLCCVKLKSRNSGVKWRKAKF